MAGKGSEKAGELKGAMDKLGKALSGYHGIFRTLAQEHGEVSVLMGRVSASRNDSDVRDELFPKIRQELMSHAKAEEQEFYPALAKHEQLRPMTEHAVEEHHEIERLLERLHVEPKGSDTWKRNFDDMMHRVQEHVREEEDAVFVRAKDLVSKEEAEALDTRFRQVKETYKKDLV